MTKTWWHKQHRRSAVFVLPNRRHVLSVTYVPRCTCRVPQVCRPENRKDGSPNTHTAHFCSLNNHKVFLCRSVKIARILLLFLELCNAAWFFFFFAAMILRIFVCIIQKKSADIILVHDLYWIGLKNYLGYDRNENVFVSI